MEQVELKQRDIAEGFDERDVDAVFLDVRTPWVYLSQVWEALAAGGFFGAVIPTANQVSELIAGLNEEPFGDVGVCEILLRSYKPVAERLRPVDRMVAHTGYLVFARKLEETPPHVVQATEDIVEETTDSVTHGEATGNGV